MISFVKSAMLLSSRVMTSTVRQQTRRPTSQRSDIADRVTAAVAMAHWQRRAGAGVCVVCLGVVWQAKLSKVDRWQATGDRAAC